MVARATLVASLACASGLRRQARTQETTTCGLKGEAAPSLQIVNGDDAKKCEWPWQIGMRVPAENGGGGGNRFHCGGTLIGAEWVLTAAHCLDEPRAGVGLEVALGSHNQREADASPQNIAAAAVYLHPSYNKANNSYDIALIRLDTPAKVTSCVRPACLPTGGDVEPGTKCWITGWGTLTSNGVSPDTLQEAEVTIWKQESCTGWRKYNASQIDETMMCAQGSSLFGGVRDACQGDSGGPLVCEGDGGWTVYGATSWGEGCADRNKPGIWSRVHESLAWMQRTMASAPAQVAPVPRCEGEGRTIHSMPNSYGRCYCRGALKFCEEGKGKSFYPVECEACKCTETC